jgi:outer membrane protein assembly factor BamD
MLKLSRSAVLLVASAAVLSLTACAHGAAGSKGDTAYVARDVNTLYAAAKRTMDQGDYQQAAKLFDEVERQHPYSIWARRAQVMSAFNYYLAQKYNDAIASARRFITIHPGNAEAAYAQYLLAMSYYQQIEDVTRDQATTQSASDAFGELIRRYPETRYAADARLKLDLINDHLAGKQMEVGRFYERSGQWLASTYYFRDVVDKYQTTSHVPEALERLVEANLALGLPDEAWKSAAVLGANYSDTFWYRQSLRLLIKERQHTQGRTYVEGAEPSAVNQPSTSYPSSTSYPQGSSKTPKAAKPPKPPKPQAPPATSYPQRPGATTE